MSLLHGKAESICESSVLERLSSEKTVDNNLSFAIFY